MIIPYKKLRNDFYDSFYDLENMQYIIEKMLNTASLTPLLYGLNESSIYFNSWNNSCFKNDDFDYHSMRKKDEATKDKLIEYIK